MVDIGTYLVTYLQGKTMAHRIDVAAPQTGAAQPVKGLALSSRRFKTSTYREVTRLQLSKVTGPIGSYRKGIHSNREVPNNR